MSEFTDLVTDVEKLIRQKTVLMAENERLKENIEIQRKESSALEANIDSIKAQIESDRVLSAKKIEDFSKNQSRVIAGELDRLNEASKTHEIREKENSGTEARQRQKENELRGFEASLLEREKTVIIAESKQKITDTELSAKNDDISIKLGRLESHLAQLKLILQQDKDLKNELVKIQEANKIKELELKNLDKHASEKNKKATEIEVKNEERVKSLDFLESELNKEIKQNNDFRVELDNRKKALDDKERALDAEKTEMAMRVAKSRVSKDEK